MAKENKELRGKLCEHEKNSILLRQSISTRCIETQTEPCRGAIFPANRVTSFPGKQTKKAQNDDQLNRLTIQHTNLLRRYDREVKSSLKHVEEVSSLTMKVIELEQRLSASTAELSRLKNESTATDIITDTCRCSREDDALKHLQTELSRLQAELSSVKDGKVKLENQYKSLKKELQSLDPGFFEEIEDLKFALQQSALLNREYEKTLKNMCLRFGIPYPRPEQLMSNN